MRPGLVCLRNVLSDGILKELLTLANQKYKEGQQANKNGLQPACSMRLSAFSSKPWLVDLAHKVAAGLSPMLQNALEAPIYCDMDQIWFRRQCPPANRPPNQHPHVWHQDGALKFDFMKRDPKKEDVLKMVTCWIPLTTCGSTAPGLELVDVSLDYLLKPEALVDEAVGASFSQHAVRPRMVPGDVLLFDGATLHKTYVVESMTRDRISIEFRFLSADHSERLEDDWLEHIQV